MIKNSEVWVVDDDASIRWVLERALVDAGLSVREFGNIDEAMRVVGHELPNVGPARRAAQCEPASRGRRAYHRSGRRMVELPEDRRRTDGLAGEDLCRDPAAVGRMN